MFIANKLLLVHLFTCLQIAEMLQFFEIALHIKTY